jgi:hypothetical protein
MFWVKVISSAQSRESAPDSIFFDGERIRLFNSQHLKTLRAILGVDFYMHEGFEQGRCWIQGAIDDRMALGMPTTGYIQATHPV